MVRCAMVRYEPVDGSAVASDRDADRLFGSVWSDIMDWMMDEPWLLIALPICLVVFFFFEGRALLHPDRENTLSRFIYNTGKQWPLSLYFAGMFTGILIVHLFAHWCPRP